MTLSTYSILHWIPHFQVGTLMQVIPLILTSNGTLPMEQASFNIKILTKHSLHNLTKPQQQNTDQTSVSKFRLNFDIKLLTKTCAQSLNKI